MKSGGIERSMATRKSVKKYNIVLVDIAYKGKPDKVITDKDYELSEIIKAGEALAKEFEYSTFKIQEAKPKRTRKTATPKAEPETPPKKTTRKKAAPKAEPKAEPKKKTTRKKAESTPGVEKPKRTRKTTAKKEVAETKPKRTRKARGA